MHTMLPGQRLGIFMFFSEIHQVIGVPIKLPRHRVQDIDTPEDWARAGWMFKIMQWQVDTE